MEGQLSNVIPAQKVLMSQYGCCCTHITAQLHPTQFCALTPSQYGSQEVTSNLPEGSIF